MRTNKFLALAALATLMASCSNEDHFSSEENLKDTPMTFTVGVGDMATRAGYDNSNLPPYFFVNIDTQGVPGVLMWIAILAVAFIGVGYAFYGLDRLKKKK